MSIIRCWNIQTNPYNVILDNFRVDENDNIAFNDGVITEKQDKMLII